MRKFEVAKGFENHGVVLPTRATEGSAGYDIRILIDTGVPRKILPHEKVLFHTGVKVCMEEDEVLQIHVRSSVGIKKNLTLVNNTGIIDSSYYGNPQNDGEIMIVLYNNSDEVAVVENNERVAQGIFMKYLTTDDDNVSVSRVGGIGSTNYEGYTEQRTA